MSAYEKVDRTYAGSDAATCLKLECDDACRAVYRLAWRASLDEALVLSPVCGSSIHVPGWSFNPYLNDVLDLKSILPVGFLKGTFNVTELSSKNKISGAPPTSVP